MAKWRGVNLGGWLVLERWMTPSLFEGLKCQDETSFCLELGSRKKAKLKKHRQEFITEADLKWIAERGLNAIRVPLPHWIFGGLEPYEGAIGNLDWAMDTASKHGLRVLVDLHTAPGSQNGWSHSGLAGNINWHKHAPNINQTLEVLAKLTERYADRPNLIGIELLNEPHWTIPKNHLRNFYQKAYEVVRNYCSQEVAVVISDNFRPKKWREELTELQNVPLDLHLYQCYSRADKNLDIGGHLRKTEEEWAGLIASIQSLRPVIVGEWSLGLAPQTFKSMSDNQQHEAVKQYGHSQLATFDQADGWFFWNYKTEDRGGWNFRSCVEDGRLPSQY